MASRSGPVVTPRQLNRALLARQSLLGRRSGPFTGVLEGMGGLQAQYAPSMYLGLWSRAAGFERQRLTQALEQRRVVQGTLQRVTIHLVTGRQYWPFAIAVRQARRALWVRGFRRHFSEAEIRSAADRVRERLRDGPVTRKELDAITGGSAQSNGAGLWIDLVRIPPSGTWERRRADLYAAAEDWVGPPPAMSEEQAVDHVVRGYLGGFGPSTASEIADWAGLPAKVVAAAFGRLRLRRMQAADGTELVDRPGAPLPDGDVPAPVRFLPVWDAILLVHARRKGVLAATYRPRIFNTKTPHSVNTFLVDGTVAGTWRYEKGTVAVEPFERLPRSTARDVAEEADRLAAFHA